MWAAAAAVAYAAADLIDFAGQVMRRDIGRQTVGAGVVIGDGAPPGAEVAA